MMIYVSVCDIKLSGSLRFAVNKPYRESKVGKPFRTSGDPTAIYRLEIEVGQATYRESYLWFMYCVVILISSSTFAYS